MQNDFFFLAALTLIFIHEMDAIRCREWRLFPVLSSLDDKVSSAIFIVLHIPLFYWILSQISGDSSSETFRIGFDIFMIVHIVLHLLFLKHKNNEFKGWVSWGIILGAGLFGALDLFWLNLF